MRRRASLCAILLLAASPAAMPWFLAVPSLAASAAPLPKTPGSLGGIVLGPDDKPVAYASVTYESSAGRSPHVVRTDARGRFRIAKLRPDNYDVRATSKGIFSEWEKNITVSAGRETRITLRLIYTSLHYSLILVAKKERML